MLVTRVIDVIDIQREGVMSKPKLTVSTPEYKAALSELIDIINVGLLEINQEMIHSDWAVGETIVEKQELNGWSRSFLEASNRSGLICHEERVLAIFERSIPEEHGRTAVTCIIKERCEENELENGLVANLRDFFLELRQGFCFCGEQYSLVVDNKQYYVDLLFYHQRLRRFIAIGLKLGEFELKDIGLLSGYLSIIDKKLRVKGDKPSIGLLLCKSRDKKSVESSPESGTKPIGVARYVFQDEESKKDLANLPDSKNILGWIEENL